MHFTHPTLLSQNIPNIKSKYDHLLKFRIDEKIKNVTSNLRGNKSPVLPPVQAEDLAVKDPIAYNPNHFHRYREPPSSLDEDMKRKEENTKPEKHSTEVPSIQLSRKSVVDGATDHAVMKIANFSSVNNKTKNDYAHHTEELQSTQQPIPLIKDTTSSDLKSKLLEKLKKMKEHHESISSLPGSDSLSQAPPVVSQKAPHDPHLRDEISKSVNISSIKKSSTAYDLPSDIIERLKNHKSQETDSVRGKDAGKIDYCKSQTDPFEKVQIDRFIPPKDAPFEEVARWNKRIKEFVKSISKMKIGGNVLREKLEGEVAELKILRFKMFCKYL